MQTYLFCGEVQNTYLYMLYTLRLIKLQFKHSMLNPRDSLLIGVCVSWWIIQWEDDKYRPTVCLLCARVKIREAFVWAAALCARLLSPPVSCESIAESMLSLMQHTDRSTQPAFLTHVSLQEDRFWGESTALKLWLHRGPVLLSDKLMVQYQTGPQL